MTRRAVRSISVPGEFGVIMVSAAAIEGLICSLEADFSAIRVQKVLIRREQNVMTLHIQVDFNSKTTGLPEICRNLQKAALDALQRVFGITDIRTVSVGIRKCAVYGNGKTEASGSEEEPRELSAEE